MNKIYYQGVDEEVYHEILENGLDVNIIKKSGFTNKCAYFATRFGSFNTGDTLLDKENTTIIGGLAHFLEHRVFDYKEKDVINLYYNLGADVSAYTSYDRTVYYFSGNENFEECLSLLLDFPTSFTMKPEAVEKEKEIIIREILMYKDDPNDQIFKALMNCLYSGHPISGDIGGEVEEVRNTTWELLKKVHSTFYDPKNMFLVIVGDVDIESTMKLIKSKNFPKSSINYKRKELHKEKKVNKEKEIIKGNVTNKKILIGYKLDDLDNLSNNQRARTLIAAELLNYLLFAKSSDFYKEMLDSKDVSSLGVDLLEYQGLFALIIESDILKNDNLVIDKIKARVDNADKVINDDRLNAIKKKEIADIIKSTDSCNALGREYITYLLGDLNYFEVVDIIKTITKEDLLAVYNNYYKNAECSYVIMEPQD